MFLEFIAISSSSLICWGSRWSIFARYDQRSECWFSTLPCRHGSLPKAPGTKDDYILVARASNGPLPLYSVYLIDARHSGVESVWQRSQLDMQCHLPERPEARSSTSIRVTSFRFARHANVNDGTVAIHTDLTKKDVAIAFKYILIVHQYRQIDNSKLPHLCTNSLYNIYIFPEKRKRHLSFLLRVRHTDPFLKCAHPPSSAGAGAGSGSGSPSRPAR